MTDCAACGIWIFAPPKNASLHTRWCRHRTDKAFDLDVDLLMNAGEWRDTQMGNTLMMLILSLTIFAASLVILLAARGVKAFLRMRGTRLVKCPENHCAAAVELDAKGAGVEAFRGGDYLCLQDCSRWPERKNCAQECLTHVEALGSGCLVRNVVAEWYKGKVCVYCHKPVDNVVEWTGHIPALLTPDAKTLAWDDVPAETLPSVFATHQPVCWSCHVAESFRRQHPELVTDRPARW